MKAGFVCMMCMMTMLTGCGGVVFRQIDLVYNPNNTNSLNNSKMMPTVYLQKPNIVDLLKANSIINQSDIIKKGKWTGIGKVVKTQDAINYCKSRGIEAYLMTDNNISEFSLSKNINIDSTFVNVGINDTIISIAKSPEDWVLGATGIELKTLGYNVEFVNSIPDDALNGIIIKVNNIFSRLYFDDYAKMKLSVVPLGLGAMTVTYYCRGYIDLDFIIINNGQKVKEFNIKHEADFDPTGNETGGNKLNCNQGALPATLSQVLQQAVPTIVKSLAVPVSRRVESISGERSVETREATQEEEVKASKAPAKTKVKANKAKAKAAAKGAEKYE